MEQLLGECNKRSTKILIKKGIKTMNNLKLVTTETFTNLSCDFYRNVNDVILTKLNLQITKAKEKYISGIGRKLNIKRSNKTSYLDVLFLSKLHFKERIISIENIK